MKLSNIEIISDGTSKGTKVLICGEELRYVTCVEIDPITTNGRITATLKICNPILKIKPKETTLKNALSDDKVVSLHTKKPE